VKRETHMGNLVSPAPCRAPERIILTARSGSQNALMRR
jgi:hypothetical protein